MVVSSVFSWTQTSFFPAGTISAARQAVNRSRGALFQLMPCQIVIHRLHVLVGRARRVAVPFRVEVARRSGFDHLLLRLARFEELVGALCDGVHHVAKLFELLLVR